MVVPDLPRFKDRGHPSVLPQDREVMGEENCVEDQEGDRLLEKMLQDSVRYTVWARSLAEP
jgi:hypothetical protein